MYLRSMIFFFDFVTFAQQIVAPGRLLYRHPHNYYYAQRIGVPSRTLWQWNTGVLMRKALNLIETLPTLVIQFQLINKVFHSGFPCGNSVLQ